VSSVLATHRRRVEEGDWGCPQTHGGHPASAAALPLSLAAEAVPTPSDGGGRGGAPPSSAAEAPAVAPARGHSVSATALSRDDDNTTDGCHTAASTRYWSPPRPKHQAFPCVGSSRSRRSSRSWRASKAGRSRAAPMSSSIAWSATSVAHVARRRSPPRAPPLLSPRARLRTARRATSRATAVRARCCPALERSPRGGRQRLGWGWGDPSDRARLAGGVTGLGGAPPPPSPLGTCRSSGGDGGRGRQQPLPLPAADDAADGGVGGSDGQRGAASTRRHLADGGIDDGGDGVAPPPPPAPSAPVATAAPVRGDGERGRRRETL